MYLVWLGNCNWYVNGNGYVDGYIQIKLAIFLFLCNVAHPDYHTELISFLRSQKSRTELS